MISERTKLQQSRSILDLALANVAEADLNKSDFSRAIKIAWMEIDLKSDTLAILANTHLKTWQTVTSFRSQKCRKCIMQYATKNCVHFSYQAQVG